MSDAVRAYDEGDADSENDVMWCRGGGEPSATMRDRQSNGALVFAFCDGLAYRPGLEEGGYCGATRPTVGKRENE